MMCVSKGKTMRQQLDLTSFETIDPLASHIATHVATLCAGGHDRLVGSQANQQAVNYVAAMFEKLEFDVERLEFPTYDWQRKGAHLVAGTLRLELQPGPFSPSVHATGPLLAASSLEELDKIAVHGCVLLLYGPLCSIQLTPRHYPWYQNPEHVEILDRILALRPCAVLSATHLNPNMTAAQSPFPLIEDLDFDVPSAYFAASTQRLLRRHLGKEVRISIDSQRVPTTSQQVIARRKGAAEKRIVIAAHIDTKAGTMGALDNATGVATMLAIAELMVRSPLNLEFVPFNGEDHPASPGEVAYFGAYPKLDDIGVMINLDCAGAAGGPSHVSQYGLSEQQASQVKQVLQKHAGVVDGEAWIASDHAIFSMRQVPCLAVTSYNLKTLMQKVVHTDADTPDQVDTQVLANTARALVDLIQHFSNPL
jgi:aminopeptidase YwaD